MWIIPSVLTRARVQRLIELTQDTGMTAGAVCLVDIREPRGALDLPANWTVVPALGPLSLSETVRIAMSAAPFARGHAMPVGILPADHAPRTRGWDRALEDAAGDWSIACSNDLMLAGCDWRTGEACATGAVCFGAGLVRVVGDIVPDGMSLTDARLAWTALGTSLRRLDYMPGVVVQAPHAGSDGSPRRKPDPMPGLIGDDRAALFRWLNDDLRPLVARILEAMAREAVKPVVMAEIGAGCDAHRAV